MGTSKPLALVAGAGAGLGQSLLAREFQPTGVHACCAILDGIKDTARSRDLHRLDPTKMMKVEDIAEGCWQLTYQPKSAGRANLICAQLPRGSKT